MNGNIQNISGPTENKKKVAPELPAATPPRSEQLIQKTAQVTKRKNADAEDEENKGEGNGESKVMKKAKEPPAKKQKTKPEDADNEAKKAAKLAEKQAAKAAKAAATLKKKEEREAKMYGSKGVSGAKIHAMEVELDPAVEAASRELGPAVPHGPTYASLVEKLLKEAKAYGHQEEIDQMKALEAFKKNRGLYNAVRDSFLGKRADAKKSRAAQMMRATLSNIATAGRNIQ